VTHKRSKDSFADLAAYITGEKVALPFDKVAINESATLLSPGVCDRRLCALERLNNGDRLFGAGLLRGRKADLCRPGNRGDAGSRARANADRHPRDAAPMKLKSRVFR
jgi:hypothetical protein